MPLPVKFTYSEMLWQLVSQIHLLFLQMDLFMLRGLTDGNLEPLYLLQVLFYIHWKLEYIHYHRPGLAVARFDTYC